MVDMELHTYAEVIKAGIEQYSLSAVTKEVATAPKQTGGNFNPANPNAAYQPVLESGQSVPAASPTTPNLSLS